MPDLLLVEDNSLHVRLVKSMLAEIWPNTDDVRTARSLKNAMLALEESRPDCVLLDLLLPDADGLQAVNAILAVDPSVPIVVLSSHEDDETALQAVKEGAQDYLVKGSVAPDGLARAIRFSIQRHRMDRPGPDEELEVGQLAPAGVAVLDAAGTVLYARDELIDMLGRPESGVVGVPLSKLTHPNDMAAWTEALESDPGSSPELSVRLRHASGNDINVRVELSPMRGAGEIVEAHLARYYALPREGTASSGGSFAVVSGLKAG